MKICEVCGVEMFTTAVRRQSKVFSKGDNFADFPIESIKPGNWFECPERSDCFRINK